MELVSYVDKEYFNEMDLEVASTFPDKDDEDNAGMIKHSIRATLLASKIKTNLSNKECIKYYKRIQDQTSIPTSWKEEIIFKAILEKNFEQVSEIKQIDPNAVYFLKGNDSPLSNKIMISDYHNKKEYLDNLCHPCFIDDQMNDISVIKHVANSIVIVDPYIFTDTAGLAEKLPNIIKFLKQFFITPNETYYLSFISRNTNDNLNIIIASRFNSIKEAFLESTIIITGFFPKGKIFGNNRYFFTNYCSCGYQHLFDRPTQVSPSCLFVHSTGNVKKRLSAIQLNYASVNNMLQKIVQLYNSEPEKIGLIKIKIGNILNNPIFK